ncbi:tRNA (guanosine(46)-N7)-methyltransferase TrmB [Lentibacillus amyloliquefaciens]|uniref:tRNA (guanine-N(7)-)-methyltransferase n=1 Tax=Lentibacillus amyloliquefaciens TaxID=1472767 RepID=A0A0U4FL15_9BACI|nr:tRNA (guanosine(46)-N7)-methyltransferase TrmB [Lentibacillus amyloliquefaciens]ALX48420.1 tRNA (guanine-N7)-methyltransferase [Lentibacillus amyloliquefaciens]
MRQRHKPWADDFLKENTHLIVPDATEKKGKWHTLFGNENPIHLEIGTGKGQFITGMAEQYPDVNFLGIELAKSIIVMAGSKVKEAERTNVRLLHVDAADLKELFTENEISVIYLNFSDPWPKKRHAKRRLTYHTFLEQYQHILHPEGQIVLKTDNQGLFEYSLASFSQFGLKLQEVNLDLHNEEDPVNVMTEYEEKFSAKGQPIYRCRAQFP